MKTAAANDHSLFRRRNIATKYCEQAILPREAYASAVLGIVILSVCPYVSLSVCHTRALYETKEHTANILISHEKNNHSSFLSPTKAGGRCPLPPEICV